MPSPTWEESIELDKGRVRFIDHVMSDLGFRQYLSHESHRGLYKFTDSILYLDDESGDSVSVSFLHGDQTDRGLKIVTQAEFNNKIKSPEWQSLHEFQNQEVPDDRRREYPNR